MRQTILSSLVLAALLPASLAAQTQIATATLAGATICFDEARQRLTAFSEDTIWEWDATRENWARLGTAAIGRALAATYAPWARRVYVAAGGQLLAFDGHSFEALAPLPTGVSVSRLIADPATSEIVALGGQGVPPSINHHRWDGSAWRSMPAPPTQRILMGEAYDAVRGALVIEVLKFSPTSSETWEWDGAAWVMLASSGIIHGELGYDPVRQQVVGSRNGITWGWDGSTWTQLNLPGAPSQLIHLTSTPGSGGLFARGSLSGSQSEMWVLDGLGWRELTLTHPRLSQTQLTYDEQRARTVVYNGAAHAEFDGAAWTAITNGLPPARSRIGQTYDAGRGETVVFGGFDANSARLAETWTFDGQTWRQAAASGPSPRIDPRMTFDAARQRVILVGGLDGSPPFILLRDHWEWDGISWTLVQANTPFDPGRSALGYDRARARAVHVDGVGDTREFDGTQWQLIGSGNVFPYGGRLAWNGLTQRLQSLMQTQSFNPIPQDFEWDGTAWTAIGPFRDSIVFDGARGALLEYGPNELKITSPTLAAATAYGSGCGGQSIRTSLTAFGLPRPGANDLVLDLRADAAFRPAIVGFATSRGSVALGNGCALLLQNPVASAIWFTDGFGILQLPLAIPADQSLQGFTFDAQGAVLDPGSPGGIALTQGLELAIGS